MHRATTIAVSFLLTTSLAASAPKTTGWTEVRTPNFTLYSHAPARQTKKIATDLERFREVLNLITRGFEFEATIPTQVFVFRNDAELAPYKTLPNGSTANVAGFFMDRALGNFFAIDASAGATPRRILYHEYLHSLLHTTFEFLPTWVDEGLAEYYSTFEFRDASGTAQVGHPIEHHLVHLAHYGLIPLDELLATTTRSPTYNEGERQGIFYAQSWLLVHYLAATEERQKQFGRFLVDVQQGKDPDQALVEALGISVGELARRLDEYRQKGSDAYWIRLGEDLAEVPLETAEMGAAEVLYELGNLLVERGTWNVTAAREHLEASLKQGGPEARIYSSLGYLAEQEGSDDEARKWYEKAVATGQGDADLYARYGRFVLFQFTREHSMVTGDTSAPEGILEARELLRIALEKDPDHVAALVALGKSYWFGNEGTAHGRVALIRAATLRPFRTDIVQDLACLLAKAGRIEDAKTLTETRLRGRDRGPEYGLYAEQWIVKAEIENVNQLMERGDELGALAVIDRTSAFVTDEELKRTLAQIRGSIESTAGRVSATIASPAADDSKQPLGGSMDRFAEAMALANEGRFDEAMATLEELIATCTEQDLCAHWERAKVRVHERVESALYVDRYNHAVRLANSGKTAEAIEVLRELEKAVKAEERLAKIRETLGLLGAS